MSQRRQTTILANVKDLEIRIETENVNSLKASGKHIPVIPVLEVEARASGKDSLTYLAGSH